MKSKKIINIMEYPKEKINAHQVEAVKKFNNDPNIK